MANEVKLNSYLLQLRSPKPKGRSALNHEVEYMHFNNVEYEILSDGGRQETGDFVNLFSHYVNEFAGKFHVEINSGRAVYIPSDKMGILTQRRIFHGILEGGRSGITRSIKDRYKADDEAEFIISDYHVDSNEYFFMLWVPENMNVGILLIQGFSTSSYSDTLVRHLSRYFSRNYNLIAEFSRIVPREIIDKMKQEGNIDKIVLERHHLNPDRANSIIGVDFIQSPVTIKIIVEGLKSYTRQLKEAILNPDAANSRFITTRVLTDMGMDGDHDLSIEYERDGKKATAKASTGFQLKPYHYVEEKYLKIDPETKLPTLESIKEYCLTFIEDLKSEIFPPGFQNE